MKTKERIKNLLFRVPKNLKKNWVNLNPDQLAKLKKSIEENYHPNDDADLWDHLTERNASDRQRIVPWLNSIKPLANSTILEIGCGTGSSTLAFAEQGSLVTAIDVDEKSLKVARDRLEIAGRFASVWYANADYLKQFDRLNFDFIIYFATFEHMTISERIESLRQAWNMLKPGSFLVIIETPNRLWYDDSHTSGLKFFNWLPDDLAFLYSKYSPKPKFNTDYRNLTEEIMMQFHRRGRGVSYHDFEIALDRKIDELGYIETLAEFEKLDWLKLTLKERFYKWFLRSLGVPKAFCNPYLNFVIKK